MSLGLIIAGVVLTAVGYRRKRDAQQRRSADH